MKKHESIVNYDIMKYFTDLRGKSLMNHAANSCNIENTLAVVSVFCPEIIEIKEYIFISEFYNNNIDSLKETYGKNRKQQKYLIIVGL